MKKIFTLAVAVLTLTASIATAASPKDVQEIIKHIEKGGNKLLSHSKEPRNSFKGSYKVDGKQYTVYYSGQGKYPSLSIDIRKKNKLASDVVIDDNLDGIADFGGYYPLENSPFVINDREGQKVWQKRYDTAITTSLRYFQK